MGFRILVVDDAASLRRSLARQLTGDGYSVRVADCARAALDEARRESPDLVLLDICLPDTSGLEVLPQLKRINSRAAIIVMTAYESTRDAVLAMKRGAYDYLSKPFDIGAMRLLVEQALESGRAGEEDLSSTGPGHGSACDRMIGTSPAMKKVLEIIRKLPADSVSNILAEGETGTGKELLARAIHETSCRAGEPFVVVCCAAIPRELMESELFGYEGGAFTGARPEGRRGLFEQAGAGTVFLDEIGELDLNLQAKLLRVLEAREFSRISSSGSVRLRARIIAATNRDLKREVEEGRFRADLYYRLNVVQMTLPPLREHRADIMPLVETFMREYGRRFGKEFASVSPQARKLLEEYAWPGNVRELRNVVERTVLLETGEVILPEHLPDEITSPGLPATLLSTPDHPTGERLLERVERTCIAQILEETGGNVNRAARLLGLKRGALRYRMDKYGLGTECSR